MIPPYSALLDIELECDCVLSLGDYVDIGGTLFRVQGSSGGRHYTLEQIPAHDGTVYVEDWDPDFDPRSTLIKDL